MDPQDKILENRLRRMAGRRGMRVVKSRRRDPNCADYGGYMILDDRNLPLAGGHPFYSMTLEDVKEWLDG